MSNTRSLFTGAGMLIAGIVLRFFGSAVALPVISLSAVGAVLIVLGALELVLTAGWITWSSTREPARTDHDQR